MTDQRCSDCRFWQSIQKEDHGQCRRYAPRGYVDDFLYADAILETMCGLLQCFAERAQIERLDLVHGFQYLNEFNDLPLKEVERFAKTWPDEWCGEFEERQ